MKTIQIKAGERKRIIFQFSNSLLQTYNFSAKTLAGDKDASGTIEVKGSNWIFPKAGIISDLKPENSVEKGMWETIFSVYVTPESDTEVTLTSAPVKNLWLYLIIILVVVAIASSFFLGS